MVYNVHSAYTPESRRTEPQCATDRCKIYCMASSGKSTKDGQKAMKNLLYEMILLSIFVTNVL